VISGVRPGPSHCGALNRSGDPSGPLPGVMRPHHRRPTVPRSPTRCGKPVGSAPPGSGSRLDEQDDELIRPAIRRQIMPLAIPSSATELRRVVDMGFGRRQIRHHGTSFVGRCLGNASPTRVCGRHHGSVTRMRGALKIHRWAMTRSCRQSRVDGVLGPIPAGAGAFRHAVVSGSGAGVFPGTGT